MGWMPGQGLGPQNQGITAPVNKSVSFPRFRARPLINLIHFFLSLSVSLLFFLSTAIICLSPSLYCLPPLRLCLSLFFFLFLSLFLSFSTALVRGSPFLKAVVMNWCVVGCFRGNVSLDGGGLGIVGERPNDVKADDDEFDMYRKRMMLAYKFRPNPLNNPRRPYY